MSREMAKPREEVSSISFQKSFTEKGKVTMKMIFSRSVAAILTSVMPASALPPRGYCAKQPTIDACVACSETSPYKQSNATPAGLRLWCQAKMPRRAANQ
jgi:hypothetical protein